jgi:hypothetical protein
LTPLLDLCDVEGATHRVSPNSLAADHSDATDLSDRFPIGTSPRATSRDDFLEEPRSALPRLVHGWPIEVVPKTSLLVAWGTFPITERIRKIRVIRWIRSQIVGACSAKQSPHV